MPNYKHKHTRGVRTPLFIRVCRLENLMSGYDFSQCTALSHNKMIVEHEE